MRGYLDFLFMTPTPDMVIDEGQGSQKSPPEDPIFGEITELMRQK